MRSQKPLTPSRKVDDLGEWRRAFSPVKVASNCSISSRCSARQVDRRFDHDAAIQVAGLAAAHRLDALVAQAEHAAGLGFGRNADLGFAAERRHRARNRPAPPARCGSALRNAGRRRRARRSRARARALRRTGRPAACPPGRLRPRPPGGCDRRCRRPPGSSPTGSCLPRCGPRHGRSCTGSRSSGRGRRSAGTAAAW